MSSKGKKKGKKGKKSKDVGPQPYTSVQIIQDRTKMLCPRMGDSYSRNIHVEQILEDVAEKTIQKAAEKRLTELNLRGLKLSRLPEVALADYWRDLQALTEVNLARNNLFNGDEVFEALSNLGQLTKLNLSENFLNGTLSEAAGSLALLEELILDVNNLSALTPQIQNWKNLRIFSMSDNSLTGMPMEAAAWTQVVVVNLKNNKLPDIGTLPSSWPCLEHLYLGSNLMTSIPFEIGNCVSVKQLDFSRNQIQTLPLSLGNCINLELLHLGCNRIEYLPPEIFSKLLKLRELQLYKNKITVVPPEVGNLQAIQRISLASNNIRGLPDEIGSCTTLEELYLSNNAKFNYLPGSTGFLSMLKELSIRKCPALKQFPNAAAAGMTNLRELDMRAAKKQVCKISPDVVSSLKDQLCKVRGGVIKKPKGGGKKKKSK